MKTICRIRLRSKYLEGDEGIRKQERHFANVHLGGYYLKLHKDQVKYHAQRVAGDERFMRANGIDPNRRGSAIKFDKLINQITKGE